MRDVCSLHDQNLYINLPSTPPRHDTVKDEYELHINPHIKEKASEPGTGIAQTQAVYTCNKVSAASRLGGVPFLLDISSWFILDLWDQVADCLTSQEPAVILRQVGHDLLVAKDICSLP